MANALQSHSLIAALYLHLQLPIVALTHPLIRQDISSSMLWSGYMGSACYLIRRRAICTFYRLEEVHNQSSWETLRQFDARLETAAQSVMKAEWLEELVSAGGSPAEALRLPSTQPSKQVCIFLTP